MKISTIKVPQGIRYLSEWEDFGKELPDSHFILNKALTGVGATEYFLTNNEKVILCSPRCSLLDSKRTKHPEVCFYRDMSDHVLTADGDRNETGVEQKASVADINKYNEEVVKYVNGCSSGQKVPKIMVTYDSLGHVIDALSHLSPCELDTWTLVVDEFQAIFGDSYFKSLTEMMFLENSKRFKRAVFLSATPFPENYMNEIDEFKDLPYLILEWPQEMKEKYIVTNITIQKGESRKKICQRIIDKMRKGETVKFGNMEIDTKEAVFYMNNVSDIIDTVKGCKLMPDEVNILCGRSSENKLKNNGLSLGIILKENDPHKMFTFATKSVFLGVDFYSECAMSYIFADPSQRALALDISTDLPQILGRQRLERNPYRNKAVLFMKENSLGVDKEEYAEILKKKENATTALIEDFQNKSPELQNLYIKKFRSSMKSDSYSDDYLMVVDDKKTGKPTVICNTLYKYAEIRAWEISKTIYKDKNSVIKEQAKAGILGTSGTLSTNSDVLAFKSAFEGTRNSEQKIKEYCNFRLQHPDLIDELDFVSSKYGDYWDALGYKDLKALGFQESKIKKALDKPTPFDSILDNVIQEVRKRLKVKRYEYPKIKEILRDIYKKHGLKKTPKAMDIEQYLSAKKYQDSKTGKRYYDIQSLYQKNITMFPFVWRPNKPMTMTIDRFLEIIRTGKYTIKKSETEVKGLKDIISEIRKLTDHDAHGTLKRDWLPVACINGTFKYKDDSGIEKYSSFLAIDFDGFQDRTEMKKAKDHLKEFPWVYAIFETPSGLGLKAIVMHDSTNPTQHWNLYKQIMNECKLPQTDTSVIDLSRGQFLSYDPNLWKNSTPTPYHFIYDSTLDEPVMPKEKYVSASGKSTVLNETKLDPKICEFLHSLRQNILTDDAILQRLDKYWHEKRPDYFEIGNRHKSMLVMAGTLCKAGIPKNKTKEYLAKTYPLKSESEIEGVIQYAYDYNAFGCDRRTYKG